jgi:hypothetical protein
MPSNNPVATENASRCCLLISSASSGSVASGCAARTVRKTSSRSLRPLRTYVASRSSSHDRRRHNPWRALRKLRQCRFVDAEAPCERLGKPATEQWFSWPASPSRSPTFATKSATTGRAQLRNGATETNCQAPNASLDCCAERRRLTGNNLSRRAVAPDSGARVRTRC